MRNSNEEIFDGLTNDFHRRKERKLDWKRNYKWEGDYKDRELNRL